VPGTAVLTLDEPFFNELLTSIFTDLGNPAFPLGAEANGCANRITILPEGSNARTAVRFAENRVTAPLAFSGNYNIPIMGCRNFNGWAQAVIDLRYDAPQQIVFGIINVENVNLAGIDPLISNFVTPVVQNTINQRVNPIKILNTAQLNTAVPILATGGTLRAGVKDVRAEITDALRLHITYDFEGQK
jgi:hypothetical protein